MLINRITPGSVFWRASYHTPQLDSRAAANTFFFKKITRIAE